jgi:adenosine deaminase
LVSTSTIKKILTDESITIPSCFNIERDLVRATPSINLEAYLKPWEVLRLIPTQKLNLRIMMLNAFDNLYKENVKFVEIRNSIIYLAFLNEISIDKALAWFIEEMEYASDKYNIKAGLILTISRGDYSIDNFNVLLKAYKKLGKPKQVIGLDLAGNEDIQVSSSIGNLFKQAKQEYGLKITVHAGETGNIKNIIEAVDIFGADRIGHGTAAGTDIETMLYLKENDICIEVCPISNRLTQAVKEFDYHPVVEFIKHEVPFVICSDNPSIHNKSISDDYLSFYNESKRKDIIENMYKIQTKYKFLKV